MSSGVPLTARTLAHSQQNDLQRVANPRLEVNERRLRPIYDFMEIHNYRKALTEIDRLLKKQANFTACKALKCLVLLKLDRADEAQQLANELETLAAAPASAATAGDAGSIDENALTFLSQYYKDLRQFDKVVNLYETAAKREPTSEEYLCSLFMAHVRVKDYKNQVLTAQKLYKLTRKTPYYNWAVISVLLQIDANANQLAQTLYIPMALKMLEKEFFDETVAQAKSYGEMECLLYLHSLELKKDFPKALAFLNKHLDGLIKSATNESMLPAYFAHEKPLIYNYKAGDLDTAYRLAKDFLKEDNYLWNWYEVLLDTFFQFDQTKQAELVKDLHEFIMTTPDGTTEVRNVHLARIELGTRWHLARLKSNSTTLPPLALSYLSDSFFDQITSYIKTYSLKTTNLVIYDIYRALEYLSAEERARLHAFLVEQLASETSQSNTQYLINILYCARLCGDSHCAWLSASGQSLIQRLLDLSNESATPSELVVELLLLIATIMDEMKRTKAELYTLLNRASEKDPSNFDVKLYIYNTSLSLNCITIMKDCFERLEIKNIQYYSLGYLLTDHCLRIHSNYRQVRSFLNYLANLLLVYTDDSWAQIMFCYKYGNFLRINEIRTFSDLYLSYSLIYLQSLIGATAVDLIQNGNRYQSISTIFKYPSNQLLFDHKQKNKHSLRPLFYKTDPNNVLKVQDTRDLDIWPKIDYRRLRFDVTDENHQPGETPSYADRVLSESFDQSSYQSPTYKDSFLRQHQSNDFQQRTVLCYLRANILSLFHTLYVDPSAAKSEAASASAAVHMPDEQTFNTLKVILTDYDQCTKSLPTAADTITPCELSSIVALELQQTIPLFVQILLDGTTLNKPAEASAAAGPMSLSNTTVAYEKIEQHVGAIMKRQERSYQLLLQALENTSFQKRCRATDAQASSEFLDDFAGSGSPLELYSVYTEFASYAYGLYLTVRSILATLFNKTALLVDASEPVANRTSGSKKSKKKTTEQQASSGENEAEAKLWSELEKLESLFHEQWKQIIENIRQYEPYLRAQGKLTDSECERLERDLGGGSEQTSNKSKSKSDENNNDSAPSAKDGNSDNQPSVHSFALGYLESLVQIRVCLASKQKTLQLRQSST